MNLSKASETTTTITLGWTPPQGVGGYVLYAAGQVAAVATRNLKDGSPRNAAKFHKTTPGPPFEVVALCRTLSGAFFADAGMYPSTPLPVTPSLTTYPSETRP